MTDFFRLDSLRSLVPLREETVGWRRGGSFPEQAHYFLRPKFYLKALRQLRELTTFSGDALEHVDCAIYILEKQSVDNVVDVVVDMMMIKGTMMLLMLPMVMMMTVMMVEMKRGTKRFGDNDEV